MLVKFDILTIGFNWFNLINSKVDIGLSIKLEVTTAGHFIILDIGLFILFLHPPFR